MEKELIVEGMQCSGCENRLTNVLNAIEGVEVISVSHVTGSVIIKIDNEEVLDKVSEKIYDIGFKIKDN